MHPNLPVPRTLAAIFLFSSIVSACGDSAPVGTDDLGVHDGTVPDSAMPDGGTEDLGTGDGGQGGVDAGQDTGMLPPGDFLVTAPTLLSTTESGGTDTFTVVLTSAPTSNVTLPLSVSNAAEASVSPSALVFTPSDWNQPHVATVTGLDDTDPDGPVDFDVVLGLTTSTDTRYGGRNLADLPGQNADDDTAGFLISSLAGRPTEAGGVATFTVTLSRAPSASVVIPVTSTDTSEGVVSTAGLLFTTSDWNQPHTVTITGVDDFGVDGAVAFQIALGVATSNDPAYQGLDPDDIAVTTLDDDVASVLVSPLSGSLYDRSGSTATFTLRLTSQPSANVSVVLATSDVNVATLSSTTVSWTPTTWNQARNVTVTSRKIDTVDDADVPFQITVGPVTSTDPWYATVPTQTVDAVVLNDDETGVAVVSPVFFPDATCSSVGSGRLRIIEGAGPASLAFALCNPPTSDVVIDLASLDPTVTIVPATLTFTAFNARMPQTVTVTAPADATDEGETVANVTLTLSTLDPAYAALAPIVLPANVVDASDVASGLAVTLEGTTCTGTCASTCTTLQLYGSACGARGTDGTAWTDGMSASGYGYFGFTDGTPRMTLDLGAVVAPVAVAVACPGWSEAGYGSIAHELWARQDVSDPWTSLGPVPVSATASTIPVTASFRYLSITTPKQPTALFVDGTSLYCTDLRVLVAN